jgi:hypothetical protein
MRSEAVWLTLCGNLYLIPSRTDLKFIQRALFATQGVVMSEVYEVALVVECLDTLECAITSEMAKGKHGTWSVG